jgi:hypothetical protein
VIGREDKASNDLFYTCSLIDCIARKTDNHRGDIVDALGYKTINKIYEYADVYHCEQLDDTAEEFIESHNIPHGTFEHINVVKYSVPTCWDIGKVYKRLILGISRERNLFVIDALFEAYHSFVSEKIEDFNSSFYYDAPQNILNAYLYGIIE